MFLIRAIFRYGIAQRNNYLRPIGSYDFHFLSAPPKEIQNHLILINPLDGYTWAFLLASVVAIAITLILIDKKYASWFGTSADGINHQSKKRHFPFVI